MTSKLAGQHSKEYGRRTFLMSKYQRQIDFQNVKRVSDKKKLSTPEKSKKVMNYLTKNYSSLEMTRYGHHIYQLLMSLSILI